MDRRGLRAIVVLVAVAVPGLVLLAPRGQGGNPASAAGATGGPHSSMAGPTTFAAIGPTAIPASSVWDDVLAAPTYATTPAPTPARAPAATAKPTPKPTLKPTPAPTPKPAPCPLFPSDNVWNRRVDDLPVRANSDTLVASIGVDAYLHPDFSSTDWNGGLGYGIPINKVNLSTPKYTVTFDYADESDPGPYPIPAQPKIEGGSDAHMILWDREGCRLYEIFAADESGGHWYGGSGAIWNLRSNKLRPDGWTSADAAGLPILPGLARYDEVVRARFGTPSASPRREPARITSTPPATTPATGAARPTRRWASASG